MADAAPMPPEVARRVAAFLRRERDAILADWEADLRSSVREKASSPEELRDHLPELLDRLRELVEGEVGAEEAERPAEIHALTRLEQGVDLGVVVDEYSALRQCVLMRWEAEPGSDAAVVPLLDRLIDRAIAAAVQRYTDAWQRTLLALDQISAAAGEGIPLDLYLHDLIHALAEQNPAIDTIAVLLVGRDGRLHMRARVGLDEDLSVEPGEGIAGTIAARAAPLELKRGAQEPSEEEALLEASGARTIYGVPMNRSGQVIGVALMSSRSANEFSTEDKLLFRVVAERAAAGIVKHDLRTALLDRGRDLDQERRRLSAMLDLLPVGLLVIDRFGRMQAVNGAFREIWGGGAPFEPEAWETNYKGWWQDGRPLLPEEWGANRALATGERSRDEAIEICTFDGRRRTILHSAAPLLDEAGEIAGAIAAMVDITERRRVENERGFLAEAGRILAASLDLRQTVWRVAELIVPRIADACVVDLLQRTGGLEEVALLHREKERQEAAERLYQQHPPQTGVGLRGHVLATGKALSIREPDAGGLLLDPGVLDPIEAELAKAVGTTESLILPLIAHGKTVGLLTLLLATKDRHFDERDLALGKELATSMAIAVENARLYADAQEAIRARDETWAIASHELRNPLAALRLQIKAAERQIERDGAAPASTLTPRVHAAERAIERLIRLTSELLDTTRAQAGRFDLELVQLDLSELLQEVIDSHGYETLFASTPVRLLAEQGLVGCFDRSRMEQVITNLLSNAIKYGPDAPIEVRLRREGAEALLEVEDHGLGIPPEDLERIFSPFERTRASRRKHGVGLGLYIVRRIVESHGGSIGVRSVVDQGSTFALRLPLAPCGPPAT